MSEQSEDFIEKFVKATSGSASPDIFRRWIAIGMLAAVMARRCYSVTLEQAGPFYPNFYIILVGPPGTGKTIALSHARRLLKSVNGVNVGPDKITPEKLTRVMARMHRNPENDADEDNVPTDIDSSLVLMLSELNSLVTRYTPDLMDLLTGLYDNPDDYEYQTKNMGNDIVYRANLNIVAGTQPTKLGEIITSHTVGSGFPARLMLIYSDEKRSPGYFKEYPRKDYAEKVIANMLEKRCEMEGEFLWTEAAQERYIELATKTLYETQPTDDLLSHYGERRDFHLAKLAMVMSASEDARLVIEKRHLDRAWNFMCEAEKVMPEALKAAGGNQHRIVEDSTVAYVAQTGPVNEARLRRFIGKHIDSWAMDSFIENLLMQERLIAVGKKEKPRRTFKAGK